MFSCIAYHGIGDGPERYVVTPRDFDAQLSFLSSEGYVVESFEQIEQRVIAGGEQPHRYVVLTIDDGPKSVLWAADRLQTRGFLATVFVTRDRCRQNSRFITESEIRKLRICGFSFGTHGLTHRKLTCIPIKECVEELVVSKQWLEDVLGEEVRYMAAPGGFLNHAIVQLAYRVGYSLIATCKESMNSLALATPPALVARVSIRPQFSLRTFRYILEGRQTFYIVRQIRAAALAIPKILLTGFS